LNATTHQSCCRQSSEQVDYRAELAVVIGPYCKRVSEAAALDQSFFGYSLIDDVSARDLQFGDGQWTRGKSLDTFRRLSIHHHA